MCVSKSGPQTSLQGVGGKIERAREHFDDLKETVAAWERSPTHSFSATVVEHKPEGEQHTTIQHAAPLSPRIPFIVGDIVHNLRSTLDHLVCQLAVAAGKPEACKNTTQFPVCLSADDWAKSRRRVAALRPDAVAAIEGLQPYKRRERAPATDNLWVSC